jgi:hypothetical protein
VFDRPGSDRWNLASTTFPDAGPMVRIRFPPPVSLVRTRFSGTNHIDDRRETGSRLPYFDEAIWPGLAGEERRQQQSGERPG